MPFLRTAQAFLTHISSEYSFLAVFLLACLLCVLVIAAVFFFYLRLCSKALPSSQTLELSVFKGTFKYEAKTHTAPKKSKKTPKK
jgi:hypothetical protein